MKKIVSFFALITAIATLCSCSSVPNNAEKIKDLKKGMTKQQVINLLGEPLKFEKYHEPNIWFYQTKSVWMDGIITRDECTPIVFDDLEMVSGWGFNFYKKEVLFK